MVGGIPFWERVQGKLLQYSDFWAETWREWECKLCWHLGEEYSKQRDYMCNCGSQPPRRSQRLLPPNTHVPQCGLFSHWIELTSITNRTLWNYSVTSRVGSKKALQRLPWSFFDHSLWGKPTTVSWGHSSNSVEGSTWGRTGTSYQQPVPTCQPYAWAILESDPQGFRNSSPGLYLECNLRRNSHARIIQLSYSLVSDPQKLYEIINADCHFKPFNLGVICYTDNKYGSEKKFFQQNC